MLTVGSYQEMDQNKYDENWLIVRKPDDFLPQFVKELAENPEARALLQTLTDMSRGKNIMLACYCETETMCHRSIIAGILLGMGAEISTEQEYLNYYKLYQMMKKRVKADKWL